MLDKSYQNAYDQNAFYTDYEQEMFTWKINYKDGNSAIKYGSTEIMEKYAKKHDDIKSYVRIEKLGK